MCDDYSHAAHAAELNNELKAYYEAGYADFKTHRQPQMDREHCGYVMYMRGWQDAEDTFT